MGKLKTAPAQKNQSFLGKMRVLSKENDFLYRVQVYLLNAEVNRNGWKYLNLEDHKDLFVDTPLLVAYVQNGQKVGDGHNFKMKRGADGREYASFTDSTSERIVGWIRSREDIRIENVDGIDWIVADANIWSWYAAELTDMLSEQGADGMDVSIETLIDEMHIEGDVEVYTKYKILGTTILGKGVAPAVAGAHIRALSYGDDLEQLKIRVAAYEEKKQNKGVKTGHMNKKERKALEEKFEGYRMLSASDDGRHIVLLSEAGSICVYDFAEGEVTVAPERIRKCAMYAAYKAEDGSDLQVSMNEAVDFIHGDLTERLNQANAEKANAEKERDEAKAQLNKMQEAEKSRRIQAVKDAVRSELSKFNEEMDEDEKVDEAVCEEIETKADNGEYADVSDKNGEWCGDKAACDELLAKCAKKVMEAKKQKAKNNQTVHVWETVKKNSAQATGIAGLLARVNK